ncbi:unnamed protein product [Auanema sp. JU1783]|nr:unnamed protein product [Auanema sp. JU1783]
MRLTAILLSLMPFIVTMRLDPERIAARLRIEQEIENDKLERSLRGRRQLQPKEISIQVTAPLFSSRLFEYGANAGDSELPIGLDIGKKLDLQKALKFYGNDYQTIYVLSNGAIGFDVSTRTYKQDVFPKGARMIAPFWNRNDLRTGGHVYYREVTKGRALERGQSEIRYQYDKIVKVLSAVIVTWEKMQPLNADALPEENTNTFQAAFFVTENSTYANFIYSNIGWTQGAEAGFNEGNSGHHFALPTSGTGNIMYLEEYGNTGIPGEWMFEMSDKTIHRCKLGIKGKTCDEECAAGEWGADCAQCCHCSQGNCHPVTGECARGCHQCWTGKNCQTKSKECDRRSSNIQCAPNAIMFTDYDRCGEPVQRCGCLEGFSGDGHKSCKDIDECQKANICHADAICTNTPGRYFCQCKKGYSGDGKIECKKEFLYSNHGHQSLPTSKNAKVSWQLKNPLKLLGDVKDKLTISTSGVISLSDLGPLTSKHLSSLNMSVLAPFYAPIDISKGGSITVSEVTDSHVLSRTSRSVIDNFKDNSFVARSALVITYENITGGNQLLGNTFQTVLIGGSNDKKSQVTYVQFLYENMMWSDSAEAGIITNDASTSLSLPGSGTEGLQQLSQLSNVNQPGVWIYEIDEPFIQPCPSEKMLPPYCDREKDSSVESVRTIQKSEVQKNLNAKSENLVIPPIPIGAPRFITPTFENSPRKIVPSLVQASESLKESGTTHRPRPQFISTSHRPLVSIAQEDFNIDEDVFQTEPARTTFPPVMTIVPEIFNGNKKKLPDFNFSQTSVQSTSTAPPTQEPTFPTFSLNDETETANTLFTEKVATAASAEKPRMFSVKEIELDSEEVTSPEGTSESNPIITNSIPVEMTKTSLTNPHTVDVLAKTTGAEATKPISHPPIFIFTSSTTRKPATTIATPRNKPVIVTGRPTANDQAHSVADNSKLAIIIPTGIVAVWVILLIIIALVVCCRRRSSSAHLRAMYGPTYGVRPTAYAIKRGSKHLEGSYDENVDKSARLSGEMNGYNQSGRISLYGSYWNLQQNLSAASSSSSNGPSNRPSPPFNSHSHYINHNNISNSNNYNNNPTRFSYGAARY